MSREVRFVCIRAVSRAPWKKAFPVVPQTLDSEHQLALIGPGARLVVLLINGY